MTAAPRRPGTRIPARLARSGQWRRWYRWCHCSIGAVGPGRSGRTRRSRGSGRTRCARIALGSLRTGVSRRSGQSGRPGRSGRAAGCHDIPIGGVHGRIVSRWTPGVGHADIARARFRRRIAVAVSRNHVVEIVGIGIAVDIGVIGHPRALEDEARAGLSQQVPVSGVSARNLARRAARSLFTQT